MSELNSQHSQHPQQQPQQNWDTLAHSFDHWLPHLAPVTDKLINIIKPQPGDHFLDIACGTGEPALTLAQLDVKDLLISATDSASAMIEVAKLKAQTQQLTNISFDCMKAEALTFADHTFDATLSRFGIMLLDQPVQGLKEIHRTLKSGGRFALTVWGNPQRMTTMQWAKHAFEGKIPNANMPPIKRAARLGSSKLLGGALSEAGFKNYTIETRTLTYQFDSFEHYWETVTASNMMKMQLDALYRPDDKQKVIDKIATFARSYTSDKGLRIPHEYLLAHGDSQYS